MEETKLVVTERYQFQNRDKSIQIALQGIFGQTEFWCLEKIPILSTKGPATIPKIWIENLMAEIKPIVREKEKLEHESNEN